MMSNSARRERERLANLISEYENKGYSVTVPRSKAELPRFLKEAHYLPDLIAKSDSENLIIEVRSQESIRNVAELSGVSELVNNEPGWKFVLVLANPRTPVREVPETSVARAKELLRKASMFEQADKDLADLYFVFAFAALEAALRVASPREGDRGLAVGSLIRDAVVDGIIERHEAQRLSELFRLRNEILHAGLAVQPSRADVGWLIAITNSVLEQI